MTGNKFRLRLNKEKELVLQIGEYDVLDDLIMHNLVWRNAKVEDITEIFANDLVSNIIKNKGV